MASKSKTLDFGGLTLLVKAIRFNANKPGQPGVAFDAEGISAANVDVAAGTDGLGAGDLQAALQDLASRIQALEDA